MVGRQVRVHPGIERVELDDRILRPLLFHQQHGEIVARSDRIGIRGSAVAALRRDDAA